MLQSVRDTAAVLQANAGQTPAVTTAVHQLLRDPTTAVADMLICCPVLRVWCAGTGCWRACGVAAALAAAAEAEGGLAAQQQQRTAGQRHGTPVFAKAFTAAGNTCISNSSSSGMKAKWRAG